jgi:hypothetical protein
VCSFLVVGEICTNPLGHDQDECLIGHAQPIAAPEKFVGCIPNEWAVGIDIRQTPDTVIIWKSKKPARRFGDFLHEFDARGTPIIRIGA